MAVEGARGIGGGGAVDVRADLGDDGGAEGDVGHEVPVHDVDVQPLRAVLFDGAGAFCTQVGEVGGEDGGRDDGGRRHGGRRLGGKERLGWSSGLGHW